MSENFLNDFNINVMLLNETFLPNYCIYRNDRLTQPGGGNAFIVKINIKQAELPIPDNISFETNCIEIQTSKLDPNHINHTFSVQNATILLENLNAKHIEWNSTTKPQSTSLKTNSNRRK